jgi:2-polyprenyl-3-methyl-5-hydroxy-6-metoxy-1,4-benzoquinol methylase
MTLRSHDGRLWHVEPIGCPLCDSNECRPVGTKKGNYITEAFRIVECRQCGLVYVNPRLVASEIPALYDEAYYRGEGFDRTIRYDATELRTHWEYTSALTALKAVLGELNGREILDVGCGTGPLVTLLSENGANALGIDTSPNAIDLGRKNGANVRVMELNEAGEQLGRFDAVVMLEVIEHVTNPVDVLQTAAALLKPGGYILVSTGNWSLVRLEPGTPYVMPEGHICYYTPVTLAEAFRRAGIAPVDAIMNRLWIGYRLANRFFVPESVATWLAKVVHRVAPRYGPFSFGQHVGGHEQPRA